MGNQVKYNNQTHSLFLISGVHVIPVTLTKGALHAAAGCRGGGWGRGLRLVVVVLLKVVVRVMKVGGQGRGGGRPRLLQAARRPSHTDDHTVTGCVALFTGLRCHYTNTLYYTHTRGQHGTMGGRTWA